MAENSLDDKQSDGEKPSDDARPYRTIVVGQAAVNDEALRSEAAAPERVIYVGPKTEGSADANALAEESTTDPPPTSASADSSEGSASVSTSMPASASHESDEESDQTLDDLENIEVPARNAQKAVIAALVVFVVAFIVHCFLFR